MIPIRQDAVSIGDDVQDVPPVPTCSNFGVMYMGKRVSNLDWLPYQKITSNLCNALEYTLFKGFEGFD